MVLIITQHFPMQALCTCCPSMMPLFSLLWHT
uniref:Uncharacterized protein n=1 Tax=Anguilla anguilla TaxID=7936 RepID=A0A0E9W0P4_ANGAN